MTFKTTRIANSVTLFAAALLMLARVAMADGGADLLQTYDRLLPLEGGSNFRDMGGYTTENGQQVSRGVLFRSGSMVSLTEQDMNYLQQFDFKTIVDLRSREELELFPNHWAKIAEIDYLNVDYSMMEMMGDDLEQLTSGATDADGMLSQMGPMYRQMPATLKPQLKLMFHRLLAGQTPLVVNCSAGQDRTGVASAMVLTALGVPRSTIVDDYHLSTRFRRPGVEQAGVSEEELKIAAGSNVFAAMMLRFSEDDSMREPNPLYTENRVAFLQFALNAVEEQYGSVLHYLDAELDVGEQEIARLREMYLR